MSDHTYEVDYAELERFAAEHDTNAEEILHWATADPDFAERYLQTHGKINYGSYLKLKEFLANKAAAGHAFAHHNTATAQALRSTVAVTQATDAASAAALNSPGK